MRKVRHYPLAVACFSLFLSLVGFGIIIPVQPFYAESMGASPFMITSLGAIFSAMQFLFAPMWGRLSDRVGRRPVMLSSIAIGGLGHLGFGLAGTFWVLFAVRALAGFGMANQGTAQAIISDITKPEDRAKGMGLMGASFGLGFIIGPALGGFLGQYDAHYPAFAAAGLSVLNWIMAWYWLPETLKVSDASVGKVVARRSRFALKTVVSIARQYDVGRIMVTTFVVGVAFSLMEQVISLFLEHSFVRGFALAPHARMGMATKMTAWFLVTVGVVSVCIQGGLIGPLRKKFGEARLIKTGILTMAVALSALPIVAHTGEFSMILIIAGLLALGSGLYNPSSSSLLSLEAGLDDQGVVLGANQSMSALGRIAGPLLAGALYQITPEWPFRVSGVLMLAGFVVAQRISRSAASPAIVPPQSASS